MCNDCSSPTNCHVASWSVPCFQSDDQSGCSGFSGTWCGDDAAATTTTTQATDITTTTDNNGNTNTDNDGKITFFFVQIYLCIYTCIYKVKN